MLPVRLNKGGGPLISSRFVASRMEVTDLGRRQVNRFGP
jgi:hypothetical protein